MGRFQVDKRTQAGLCGGYHDTLRLIFPRTCTKLWKIQSPGLLSLTGWTVSNRCAWGAEQPFLICLPRRCHCLRTYLFLPISTYLFLPVSTYLFLPVSTYLFSASQYVSFSTRYLDAKWLRGTPLGGRAVYEEVFHREKALGEDIDAVTPRVSDEVQTMRRRHIRGDSGDAVPPAPGSSKLSTVVMTMSLYVSTI
jgi:hypothetical protein